MEMTAEDLCRMNKVLRHHLRNFATGIKSSISLLAHDAEGKLPDSDMEYFPLIDNECNEIKLLTERMNLLFDAMPIHAEGASVSEDVQLLMDQFVEQFQNKCPTANVVLKVDGDPGKLSQVLGKNLSAALQEIVMNAWEAERNGEIIIECRKDEGNLFVQVLDGGEGVTEDDLINIFLPFFTTRSKHVGMGLAIANRMVTDAGGRLSAENINGGLKVEISIPVQEAL